LGAGNGHQDHPSSVQAPRSSSSRKDGSLIEEVDGKFADIDMLVVDQGNVVVVFGGQSRESVDPSCPDCCILGGASRSSNTSHKTFVAPNRASVNCDSATCKCPTVRRLADCQSSREPFSHPSQFRPRKRVTARRCHATAAILEYPNKAN